MQLRIPLTDLYAAPGFLDPAGDAAPTLDASRVATLGAEVIRSVN